MPRRPPVALALVLLVAACARPSGIEPAGVQVNAVNGLKVSTLRSCSALKASLPAQVTAGAERRTAEPVSDTTAAWGNPAIMLRCGVPAGNPLDDPYTFNDVHWAMHDTGASRTWTTTGRKVNVAVQIPDAYSSQAELLGRLSPAIIKNLS
jgi:hypothetical protein